MTIIEPVVKYNVDVTNEEKATLRKAKQILIELKNICLNKNIDFINYSDDCETMNFNDDLFYDAIALLDNVSYITSLEKEE